MKNDSMDNLLNEPGDYRIEISGWGLDNGFFVESADLSWTAEGEKLVHVHRALPQGTIVFIRLLAAEPGSATVPVAYQVEDVLPMDRSGRCQLRLAQLHPRSKESMSQKTASNGSEDVKKACDVQGIEKIKKEIGIEIRQEMSKEKELEREEVLQ